MEMINRETFRADTLALLKEQKEQIKNHVEKAREEIKWLRGMLKEQESTIEELQNAYGYLQKQFFEVQDKLLNEQEAVEPYMDYDGQDVWRCGKCGNSLMHPSYYEADEDAKNHIRYCSHCGQAVKWDE